MTPVGFEPTQLALGELESTPLDHSGKVTVVGRNIGTQTQAHSHKACVPPATRQLQDLGATPGNKSVASDAVHMGLQLCMSDVKHFDSHSTIIVAVVMCCAKEDTPGQDRTGNLQRVRLTS